MAKQDTRDWDPGNGPFDLLPQNLILELTNACNLSCPLCTTHVAMRRPRGFLSAATFGRIVDELAASRWRPLLSMNMCGEPLLHPEVDRFVGRAAASGLRTFISTNATRLTPGLADRLVRAGLSHVALCVDGATAPAHQAYRVGSDFWQVRENCEGLLAARRRAGAAEPRVTIQTLLTAFSEGQMPEILDWAWRAGADEVHFKTLSLGTCTSADQRRDAAHLLPRNPLLVRRSSSCRRPCEAPVMQTLVYHDGRLGICCVDYNNQADLPGIEDGPLVDQLYSARVLAARQAGYRREHALCADCQAGSAAFRGFSIALDQLRASSATDTPDWPAVIHAQLHKVTGHAIG